MQYLRLSEQQPLKFGPKRLKFFDDFMIVSRYFMSFTGFLSGGWVIFLVSISFPLSVLLAWPVAAITQRRSCRSRFSTVPAGVIHKIRATLRPCRQSHLPVEARSGWERWKIQVETCLKHGRNMLENSIVQGYLSKSKQVFSEKWMFFLPQGVELIKGYQRFMECSWILDGLWPLMGHELATWHYSGQNQHRMLLQPLSGKVSQMGWVNPACKHTRVM